MPDGADDGYRTFADRSGDKFLIERPQIFERTATAGNDDDVALAPNNGGIERPDNLPCCGLSLHGGRIDNHRNGRKAALQDGQDVADCCPAR